MKLELLNEQERERIRSVIQSLLACNFLTREHDAALYIAARRYREEIAEYFQVIGWEFRVDERYEIVWLLSTGMAQRLKIAVLLGCEADVWLLDEPGANLDEVGRRMIRAEMKRGAAEGRLVLLATNDAGEEAEADEVIRLGVDAAGAS